MSKHNFVLAAICLGLCGTPALAQTASSSGFAVDVNQTVTAAGAATVNVDVGPLARTSGSAPPDFNVSNQVASVNQTVALNSGLTVFENLQTGLLTSNSIGMATGANATATVNNALFSLGASLPGSLTNLLNLSATTIQSFSQANSVGGLDASGSTTISGLSLTGTALGGLTFDGGLSINPAPNTVILDVGGLRIVLNEQILSGDGITGSGITTNAINIGFTNFAVGTGFKNGNVIFSQTQAFATPGMAAAVPEPGTWAMMLLGFGVIGASMRRRKRTEGQMLQLA